MGNTAIHCCVGSSVVTVLRPNGRIEELGGQVRVSELMARHPQHLVIHADYLERDTSFNQHRRKVVILPPESRLLPGHEYILYPIPPQFRDAVAQSFIRQKMAVEKSPSLQTKKTNRKSRVLDSILHPTGLLKYKRTHDEDFCEGGAKEPLMAGRKEAELDEFSFQYSASWKPTLHSIPEGPLSTASDVSSRDVSEQR